MNKKTTASLLFAILFASCTKEVTKDQIGGFDPSPKNINDMIVPYGFSYRTSQNVNFNITLLSNNGIPIKGVRIDIMDESPLKKGNIIATGITDKNGILNAIYNIPLTLTNVVVNTDYLGLLNNVIVSVNSSSAMVNITIGGTNSGLKTVDSPTKNNRAALGKSFNRLSFRLGTFSTGFNGGLPNYLLVNDVVTPQFLSDLNSNLPEYQSVPANNPQFLNPALQRDLLLTGQTEVWATFVHEGASNQNSLFYFVYNKNNKPTSVSQIDSLIAVFPNASFLGGGGSLTVGNKVRLGSFGADTAVGFALGQSSWNGTTVSPNSSFIYSIKELNNEVNPNLREHVVLLHDVPTARFIVGFEDSDRESPFCDQDFNDCVIYASVNPIGNVNFTNVITTTPLSGLDTDGDGVLNIYDEYPNDYFRAFNIYYPNINSYASVAYEDLWPSKGDYDVNDVVVNYQYKGVLNANNLMLDLRGKYKLRAAGGVFKNAFSVELPVNKTTVSSINGGLGLDPAANKAILRIFSNSLAIIQNYNTFKGQPLQVTDTITVNLTFNSPQNFSLSPFNPFIYVDEPGKGRSHEVHLADYTPTNLVNLFTLGTEDDNSIPSINRYYKTFNNLPFAISIPESFDYPSEKDAIIDAHLKFASWAQSGGAQFPNWYKNLPGFRNNDKIY